MADIACCASSVYLPACLVQNIAEWEMTDDDIEVAIKLADKSGDGRIDYDEFIAFVFGNDEPGYQRQTSTKSVLPEQHPPQLQAAPAQPAAAEANTLAPATLDALQNPAETLTMSSDSWPKAQEELPASQALAPQLPCSGLDSMQAAVLAARQQSLTDAWLAAHASDMTPADPGEATTQAGTVYDNALYQEEAPIAPHAGAAHHVPLWELEDPVTSSDVQMPAEQPGDDVRLDIPTDQAMLGDMQLPAEPQFEAQWSQQPAYTMASRDQDDLDAQKQIDEAPSQTQWLHCLQEGLETLQLPPDERASAASDGSGSTCTVQMLPIAGQEQGIEPGGLQAVVHGDAVHFNMPLEMQQLAEDFPEASTALRPDPQQLGQQQHATKPSSGTKSPLKAPRKLPALSYAQLSQGINRSQVKIQQLHRRK